MQFSEAWLRSLVDSQLPSAQLGHLLTMAGLEVEALEPAAPAFSQVVVAVILSAEKHPNADRLQVCQVDVGEAAPLTVVCGAPNARAGLKTACARVGAQLPGDFQIKQAKVRGVESFGMLCSAKELGLAAEADGIMELPAEAPVGAALRDWMDLDDHLITLKLTPNRGDCLSVLGIAREVAALTGAPMTPVDCAPVAASIPDSHPVVIEHEAACPRYCGRVIRGIDPRAATPDWMVRRLARSGLRPIHPVVDVTNYVLLELGQPMHGFDLSRLRGAVRARLAREGEKLELLNGQAIALGGDALVIADDTGPLALAGIMGGSPSSVTETTADVFLEAAHFAPDAIAGRARRFGLSTDSSHRFERGVDPALPAMAMERATRLILDICGGRCGPLVEAGPGVAAPQAVTFRPARARKVLGFDLDDAAMLAILERLGMKPAVSGEQAEVRPPSHRFDITREVDLIEEVARVHGYDAIPAVALRGAHVMLPAGEGARTVHDLKKLLVARGYQENITYSFTSEEVDRDFRSQGEILPLLNPIASQMGVMRGQPPGRPGPGPASQPEPRPGTVARVRSRTRVPERRSGRPASADRRPGLWFQPAGAVGPEEPGGGFLRSAHRPGGPAASGPGRISGRDPSVPASRPVCPGLDGRGRHRLDRCPASTAHAEIWLCQGAGVVRNRPGGPPEPGCAPLSGNAPIPRSAARSCRRGRRRALPG